MPEHPQSSRELAGFIYGLLGILTFSITLPANRIAIGGFDRYLLDWDVQSSPLDYR